MIAPINSNKPKEIFKKIIDKIIEEKGSKEEAGVTRGRGNFGGGSSPKPAGVAGGTRPAGRERRNF